MDGIHTHTLSYYDLRLRLSEALLGWGLLHALSVACSMHHICPDHYLWPPVHMCFTRVTYEAHTNAFDMAHE